MTDKEVLFRSTNIDKFHVVGVRLTLFLGLFCREVESENSLLFFG